jgi:hypothetical protein
MGVDQKGKIQIFAKNIRGNANGGILEESKFTRNVAGGRQVQNGKGGGVNHDVNQPKKETLKVIKVEGPFDENNKKVQILEKNKWYSYKATKFNREPTQQELLNLRWGVKYDDEKIKDIPGVSGKGYKEIVHKVLDNNHSSKLRIYAFFKTPIDNVSVTADLIKEEVIIIIGTEQHSTNIANKLMFGGEGVRKVRTKYAHYPFLKVALFTDGYSEAQISAITNAVLLHNKKATVIRVTSISDVINIISSGNRDSTAIDKTRRVKEIYAYSHGYVRDGSNEGVIAFGYEGKNAATQELDHKTFSKINAEVFLDKNATTFYSYACRTGIGISSETATSPKKDNSLAQKMANKGKITVYAFMRRSLYEDAWGTQTHRDTYASDNDAGDSGWENFKTDMKDAFKSDPKDMSDFNTYRKKEVKIDNAIWNPDGAYLDVKAGTWPIGVPATFDKYNPQ